jgi:beta-lactam-binding protein with PASTA domain
VTHWRLKQVSMAATTLLLVAGTVVLSACGSARYPASAGGVASVSGSTIDTGKMAASAGSDTVPEMAGQIIDSQSAKRMIAARPSLKFKVLKERSEIAPPGVIFLVSPSPGTRVPAGTAVTLYVSTGP